MGAHVSRHVDERLDDLEVYQRAVAATFSERSKPPSDGVDAAPGIQQAQLLDACKAVLQRVSAELDPRAGRVCLRVPTPRDLDFALSRHPALAQLPMLSFAEFERVTRCVLKRVAADRGRRLLLFVTGGVIAVQMAKGTIRKVPLVGGLVAALVSIVFPTSVVGPALGVAGALYVEQPRQLLH
ncbi:unnamed protein product [Closterium sp. NIES-64]|nr:unnamed protein product [Closterium sp. NIES-64]